MAYAPRQSTLSGSSLRQPNLGSSNAQSHQSSVLHARIASKRQELENLKQLRDLSGALANQIGALEAKLATLRDGTEAVACVLANWDNVLRAMNMASMKVPRPPIAEGEPTIEPELPVTLVRIPVQPKEQNGSNGT